MGSKSGMWISVHQTFKRANEVVLIHLNIQGTYNLFFKFFVSLAKRMEENFTRAYE